MRSSDRSGCAFQRPCNRKREKIRKQRKDPAVSDVDPAEINKNIVTDASVIGDIKRDPDPHQPSAETAGA